MRKFECCRSEVRREMQYYKNIKCVAIENPVVMS
jgi:hypothetical protein